MLQNPPFHKTLHEFFDRGQEIHFTKGEVILNPNETPEGVFFVTEGFVKVFTHSSNGNRQVVTIHKSGEVFPLPWAFEERTENQMSYQALNRVTLKRVPKTLLRLSTVRNHSLTEALLQQFAIILQIYNAHLSNLMLKKASHRVISHLLFMSERFGITSEKMILLNVPLSHQDIADTVNVSRETASREIERLARAKIIEQRGHMIIVRDKLALQKQLD